MTSDLVTLREEIDARLDEVGRSVGTCAGHDAMARALGTLLRCQRAQLNERASLQAAAARSGGAIGGVISIVIAGLVALIKSWHERA